MSYNAELANRLRKALSEVDNITEQSMFVGRCFMLHGKMLVCATKSELLCRIGNGNVDEALRHQGTRLMVNNGRISRGFVFVDKTVVDSDTDFEYWLNMCLRFNEVLTAEKNSDSRDE